MYINNELCPYQLRKEENNKCVKRIFRPWDNIGTKSAVKDNSQDSTISTTTKDEEVEGKFQDEIFCKKTETLPSNSLVKNCVLSPSESILSCNNKTSQDPELTNISTSELFHQSSSTSCLEVFTPTPMVTEEYLTDPYLLNNKLVQSNLAQHLGLPPNDPLLLESVAQGYALEEYARVLSQEQQAKLVASKKQRPKKYKCPHCDVGFSNNGQLKGHIRIHTGERPFKCDEKDCGKTFTRNEELTRHKRIHSGLRPFPCSQCGKRFGRKDHLKKHSRTHFQLRGLYAVPVVLPFEAWASGQTNGYPFFPMMY